DPGVVHGDGDGDGVAVGRIRALGGREQPVADRHLERVGAGVRPVRRAGVDPPARDQRVDRDDAVGRLLGHRIRQHIAVGVVGLHGT
ncbi:hypothetical protein DKX15_18710, partial [Enterococcus faecium]